MALILSIETATSVCSVALTGHDQIIAEKKLLDDKSHANYLTVLIQDMLKESGKETSDVEAVAVSEGPGSYTGLRIGVSTAKGLCYALGVPLIGISTLEAMALEVSLIKKEVDILCPMIDARRMEVYTALYSNSLEVLLAPQAMILDADSFNETLAGSKVLFFGNGSDKFRSEIDSAQAVFLENVTPSAWAVGLLASERVKKQEFENLAYFEPEYLKEFQATKPKSLL